MLERSPTGIRSWGPLIRTVTPLRDNNQRPEMTPDGDDKNGVAVGAIMVLAALALVAFLAVALQPAAPVEIAEVIAAAGGLLAAVAAAVRAIRSK